MFLYGAKMCVNKAKFKSIVLGKIKNQNVKEIQLYQSSSKKNGIERSKRKLKKNLEKVE